MAAIVKSRVCNFTNNFNFLKIFDQIGFIVNANITRTIKSEALSDIVIEEVSTVDETQQFEDADTDLERRRNKSRLRPHDRNLLFDQVPYSESKAWYHDTVKYKRKLYGRFGEQSGVNPGLLWPTAEELAERKSFEAIAYKSIPELVSINREKREKDEEHIRLREEDIMKKLAKLDQWKKEVTTRIAKKEADALAAKERKDRLVEEVRRHFGFKVDPREERFKEMLEQKEKAEKKILKEAKKKAKEAKMISKLSVVKETNVEPQT